MFPDLCRVPSLLLGASFFLSSVNIFSKGVEYGAGFCWMDVLFWKKTISCVVDVGFTVRSMGDPSFSGSRAESGREQLFLVSEVNGLFCWMDDGWNDAHRKIWLDE